MSIKGKKILGTIGHIDMGKTALCTTTEKLNELGIAVTEETNQLPEALGFNSREVREHLHTMKAFEELEFKDRQKTEPRPRELRIDIINNIYGEYHLIKEKRSKLSRWERDKVVSLIEAR